jgi:uncharacterized protein (TIGR03086 family)
VHHAAPDHAVTPGLAEPAPPGRRGDPDGLAAAVELLERALGYTRVALADVTDPLLVRRTPCVGWTLGDLLDHMEDALDAFVEAAGGRVLAGREPSDRGPDRAGRPAAARVTALQDRACLLLGTWSAPPATGPRVTIGDRSLATPLLVTTAALEITVHGWDVGQATGRRARIPEPLAATLLGTALRVVGPDDRGPRFARPRPAAAGAAYDERLLGFLGRDLTGPRGADSGDRGTPPGVAS